MFDVPKIPVVLVTGFLGSGKTTLLRRLATAYPNWRMVFLVNEFSAANVDGLTLETTGRPTQSVVGGSLFCECKAGEFVRVLKGTILPAHKADNLDALVIETSGIADPGAISELMTNHGLHTAFELRRIVTVVAPNRLPSLLRNLPATEAQIRCADLVLLNKTDLASPESIAVAETAIRKLNPYTEILQAQHCAIDFNLGQRLRTLPPKALSTCEANPYTTGTAIWPAHKSIEEARVWLKHLPASILRIKGAIRTPEGMWRAERTVDHLEIEPAGGDMVEQLVLIAHDTHEAILHTALESLNKVHL